MYFILVFYFLSPCMYQNLLKVETRTWRKPGSKPSFNCAVAAREGNDVIMVDMCDGPYGKTYPKLKIQNPGMFENKTEIVKDPSGNTFVVLYFSLIPFFQAPYWVTPFIVLVIGRTKVWDLSLAHLTMLKKQETNKKQ